MIQINLLPDVKQEFSGAPERNFAVSVAIIAALASVAIVGALVHLRSADRT